MEAEKIVEDVAFNILKQAVIYLPDDVKQALKKAYSEETSETGRPNSRRYLITSSWLRSIKLLSARTQAQ